MDVPGLLVRARARAGLTRPQLAATAGTSTSALSAYERGLRSPTVATLDRLLAGCGLQLRPELEPHLADVDAAVDVLLAGEPRLPDNCPRLGQALDDAGVRWAFDGRSALALHGLGVDGATAEVAVIGDQSWRQLAYRLGLEAEDRDARPLFTNWLEIDLARIAPTLTYTRHGAVIPRIVDDLGTVLRVDVEGRAWPTLSLLEVEAAFPQLAEVLVRLRVRRTVPT